MKTRALLITLFVAIAIPKVYAQYDEFFKDKYRSDTLYMENYTYVCDTVAGTVELRNILNSNDKGLMVYADTGKIPFDDIWGHEWPDHYLSPISLQQKLVDIVDEAFTPEQSAIVKGHNFGVTFYISPSTGAVTDVYFSFLDILPYTQIPIEVFRQMEVNFKEEIVFEMTDEGKRMNYCFLYFTLCPIGRAGVSDIPGQLPLPDGSEGGGSEDSGSSGDNNVHTGPAGSIVVKPMVPAK